MIGRFVISLDFELMWGVRDHADRASYGKNVLGAREAVPQMLGLFERTKLKATWATVGYLFCEGKDDLLASAPSLLPRYTIERFSNYSYFDEVGANEKDDPYSFAPSLIANIKDTPGQEIATHTHSHFYCLEDGPSVDSFAADLDAAKALAARSGIELRSIVFPRNQYSDAHLDVCARAGLTHFRGNQTAWAYRATKGTGQTKARRALRLIDAYSGVLGAQTAAITKRRGLIDVPASRFLRPNAGKLAPLHPAHIATIKHGMTQAARRGEAYHLWWHPHNFGLGLEANMAGLSIIAGHFTHLASRYGMQSQTMAGCAL